MQFGAKSLDITRPLVMGILNVTPDSFSDGGQLYGDQRVLLDRVLGRAAKMVAEGAAILDIGGESTRPGATPVGTQEELDRVVPAVEVIRKELDVVVSLDTSSPEVIREGASMGAGLINDVRALERPGALEVAAQTGLPVCLMHMKGNPRTMQNQPSYQSVVDEVLDYLRSRVDAAVGAGIPRSSIIIDPGFGFGKSREHNLELLARLSELESEGLPILAGLSRKSLIGQVLGRDVDQRLAASLSLALLAAQAGAKILRVHDVAETSDVLNMWAAVKNNRERGYGA
ncbi:dihydropteroate synthase [Pseudomaricurvus alkylphenolicus]|uniref:dihydropteroate synthase n=1 Tax=Pseudomaricurvus alkylphenolicus TaxID=1306991 RepID=UPI001421B036|nr:dihydropteroate synthase [Pseudomaricurvus alkylphenolicus]NIB44296.1 dihydropteroate synthase [Pseudomaricurvus alkylphenolicus]